jgi:uncharacterized ion transporter superfamily protein YfcC
LPGEQATLDRLGIQIRVEQFEKDNIRKPISIPGTYHTVTPNPQGVIAILKAPMLGTYEAVNVVLFVLVIGGFSGVFQKTGAFDAGLNALVIRLRGREVWLIVIAIALVSAGRRLEWRRKRWRFIHYSFRFCRLPDTTQWCRSHSFLSGPLLGRWRPQ